MSSLWSRRFVVWLALWAIWGAPGTSAALKRVRFGTVSDGQGEFPEQLYKLVKAEVLQILEGEFAAEFAPDAQIVGDWTSASVRDAADKLLADASVDVVIAIGPMGSGELARREKLSKPVVAMLVLDPVAQGIPYEKGRSGRKNLSYLAGPWELARDLKVFSDIVPFSKLAILSHHAWMEPIRQPERLEQADGEIRRYADDYVIVPMTKDVEATVAAIPNDVDAVYVLPNPQLTADANKRFYDGLIARKLPSFSTAGRIGVERGALAGLRPKDDADRLARQAALNIQSILLGEKASELPVAFSSGARLAINVRTSRTIGTSPPYRVLSEAELVDDQPPADARQLDFGTTIDEAIAANLEMAVAEQAVRVAREEVRAARGNLLPSVSLGTSGRIIDEDRAKSGNGMNPGAPGKAWREEGDVESRKP